MSTIQSIASNLYHNCARWIKGLFPRLEYLLPSIFGLLLLYFALWQNSQGLDLVAEMSQKYLHPSVLIYWVVIMGYALSLWYIPKELLKRPSSWRIWSQATYDERERTIQINVSGTEGPVYQKELLSIPRLIVALSVLVGGTIFVKYFWIVHPVERTDHYSASFILFFLIFIFYIGRNKYTDWVEASFSHHRKRFIGVYLAFLTLGIATPYFIQEALGQHDLYVWSLVFSNAIIALSTWAFLIIRTRLRVMQSKAGHGIFNYLTLTNLFWIFFIALAIVFVTCLVNPVQVQYYAIYNPTALVVIILCFLVLSLTMIYHFILRSSFVGFLLAFVVIGGIKSILPERNPYVLSRVEAPEFKKRISFDEYASRWLHEIRTSDSLSIPFYMVLCEGGGIRSAYWTSYLLSRLRDTLGPEFNRRVFSINGASGGAVGGAIYTVLQVDSILRHSSTSYTDQTNRFFGHKDFLTPALGAFFTRDWMFSALTHFIPFKTMRGRGRILEETFEQAMEYRLGSDGLSRGMTTLATQKTPLYLPHATHVQSGRRALMSPVVPPDGWDDEDIDMLGSSFFNDSTGKDLRVITSAIASARFPYLSSGAELKKGYQFVDGGYIDNFGAGTALTLIKRLGEIASDSGLIITPNIVIISNADPVPKASFKEVRDLNVPPAALANVQGHLTDKNLYSLQHFILEKFANSKVYHFNLLRKSALAGDLGQVYHFPLGWYISDYAMEGMRRNLDKDFNPENYKQFSQILASFNTY